MPSTNDRCLYKILPKNERTIQLQQLEGEGGPTNTSLDNLAHLTIQAKRERNSLLPINQLPTELLVDIFNSSLRTRSRRIYDLNAIASVAWRWNRIIKHTPMLWAVLDSTMPMKLVRTALQRAGDFPLTIKARWGLKSWDTESDLESMRGRTASEDGMTFLTTTLPKLAQWKHAHLKLVTGHLDLKKHLEQPAPLLERFSMDIQFRVGGPHIDLFQGHCPSLTEIDIKGLTVPWSSKIFHNLRSISIGSVWQHCPTVEEVIQLVGSSPRLKHFYISGFDSSNPSQDIPLVEAPDLESLSLSDVTYTQDILSRIRAPTLTKLVVEPALYLEDTYYLPTFLDVALGHFSQTIRSGIERAHSFHISVDSGNLSISTRHRDSPDIPKNEEIMLDFYHQPASKGLQMCLEFLLPSSPLCPPITLDILTLDNVSESDLQWMLESDINSRVTEISLRASPDKSFLSFLCTGRNIAGAIKWPFPRIRRLTLRGDVSGGDAVRLIRQRYAPVAEDFTQILPVSSGDLTFDPVDRLMQFEVERVILTEVDYRHLAKIVGKDVLGRGGDSDSSD
ncbi:hypothetical protein FRC01_011252 [Tulasnella sp. 417]|nr:hypothetical protein FRC01_011252 [Tulasnella sp. 417]